jgi:Ribbon-helix-helix protein, copG family
MQLPGLSPVDRHVDPNALSWNDIAMRTIVDLPDEQIRALDAYSKKHGVSRAEAVRRAIAMFLPQHSHRKLDLSNHPAFGSWKRRKIDSIDFQRKLRGEWDKRS